VDRFIVMTEFSRRVFVQGGIPDDRIVVKPHFVNRDPDSDRNHGEFFLFVGRLDETKGVNVLLRAWIDYGLEMPLKIIGSGPLTPAVKRAAAEENSIEYLGQLPQESVQYYMRSAYALVFPSVWFEPFGLVMVEAMASGVPVIASRLGGTPEIIEDMTTGRLFVPGDANDLAANVRWLWAERAERQRMANAARLRYQERYSADRNYEQLWKIYQDVCTSNIR